MLLVGAVLFLAGCKYESPLTQEHTIPVDSSLLGLWEIVPDGKEEPRNRERMMVLKYSDTEYLIHYPIEEGGMYFRGYSIKIGDVSCVQLQLIGTGNGPLDKDQKALFHVASYQLVNGELEIKTLNTDLVDGDLKDAEALKSAFLKYRDNQELFTNPGRFKRMKGKS